MAGIGQKRARHLRRLVNLMTFLANNPGVRTESVCRVFAMSRRELMAAINEMLMCGVPPYGPSDYVSAWVEDDRVTMINADFLREPLRLTLSEAVSLRVMIADFLHQSPGVFKEAANSLALTLDGLLGHSERAVAAVSQPNQSKLATIEKALDDGKALEIAYYSRMIDETTLRIVEPRAVIDIDGRWYLAAYCRVRLAKRTFRIDRIRSARLIDELVERDDSLAPEQYIHAERWYNEDAAPRVTLVFESDVARWAREQFAAYVKETSSDGKLVCEIPMTDPAVMQDIISEFAGNVTVTGTKGWRVHFREKLDQIRSLYD